MSDVRNRRFLKLGVRGKLPNIMPTSKEKKEIIKKYKISVRDTGSQELQIALLTKELDKLMEHLKKAKKDHPASRSLLKKIAKRKKLLLYLKKKDQESYKKVVKELKL